MLTVLTTSWPDMSDAVLLLDVDEKIAEDDVAVQKAIRRAFVDFASQCADENPTIDVGEIASSIDDETLAKYGIKLVDTPFVVVNQSGYDQPLNDWDITDTNETTETEPEIKIAEPTELDENGLNKKIQFHLLDDEAMLAAGFRNPATAPDTWYFCKIVAPETSFNVTIYKDGRRGRIDVLDEQFCQPYDYQLILEKFPHIKFAKDVFEKVEDLMAELEKAGIVTGHVRGEYI